MKIATFNVNGINGRIGNLLEWRAEAQPDVVCLQELKAPQEKFPAAALQKAGYGAIWHGQKAWNGVAILSLNETPREVGRVLPGDPDDEHSRFIEGETRGVRVASLYLPNGNPAPSAKFDFKLAWLKRFEAHANDLVSHTRPMVLAGDFNIIPTDLDVWAPDRWRNDALFRPEVRAAYQRLLSQGWIDAVRQVHPGERIYTFWKYFPAALARNEGLRIDHLLVNAPLARLLKGAGVEQRVRHWEKSSDHAPTWIEIEGSPAGYRSD